MDNVDNWFSKLFDEALSRLYSPTRYSRHFAAHLLYLPKDDRKMIR